MVYIHSWQEFQDAAEALYTKSPINTRYVVKWRASEGKLVLKITNDTTCIKFKTNSSIFLNRFESLNLSLMQKMQNQGLPEATPDAPSAMVEANPSAEKEHASLQPPASSSVPTQTASSGGIKKKKPKKKK